MDPTKEEETKRPAALGQNIKDKLGEFLEWGHINFESANGVIQSNCKAVEFQTADEMNKWFADSPGVFATQIFPMDGKLVAICNRVMDEEEQADLSARADAIRKYVEEAKAKRQEAKLLEEKTLEERAAEQERLIEVGKKCEHNHGAVIEENQKLKRDLKKARKEK